MQKLIWTVTPQNIPYLQKRCPKCACERFENSGCFRVNANGRKLDIWLIYRCADCKATWNLTVMERVEPKSVPRELYERFLANDAELAMRYGLDIAFLKRNDAQLERDSLELEISGELPGEGEACEITLSPSIPMDIPAGRVIAQKLDISQSAVKRLFENGSIQAGWELKKAKLIKELTFILDTAAK